MASQQPVDAATAEKQHPQQPQQQYQQYQQPGYAMTPVYAPERQVNRGWEMTKRVFHGLIILFSIVGIAIAAALLAKTNGISVGFYNEDSGIVETITACTAIPVLAIAAIWSAAELITQLCKKWRSGIHPGAHVGVFLILWLAAIVCTGLYGSIFTWSDWDYDYEDCRSSSRGSYYSYYSPDDTDCPSDSERSTQRNLSIVTLVFLAIVGILSFVLFVGACVDTNKRNRDRALSYAMARQPTIPVGWRLVPDQPQQYPHPPQQAHMQPSAHSSVYSRVASPAVPDQNRGTVNEYYTPGSAQ